MRCGQTHSQAHPLVAAGQSAQLVAETLEISRSSLYYRPQPRCSRADRRHDQRIVEVCGDKPAFGYRRVQWWLDDVGGLRVNRKRVLRVMREHGLLIRSRRFRVSRRKDWSTVEAAHPNLVWQSDMTKLWAGPTVGWAYLVSVLDCCTREIVGWDLSLRCRSQDALAALHQAVLQVFSFDPHGKGLTLTLTTDNGTQFTSTRYLDTLRQLGITHRRTAYNHPEGNGRIERFHRSLKEEEVWLHEYQSFAEARDSIARWIHQYNHQRPHQALNYRTPAATRRAFHQPQPLTKTEALCV
jgi:putative transposase